MSIISPKPTVFNCDGWSFVRWLNRVDREVSKISGLGVNDLADRPYWDQWNDGMAPADAAIDCLEYSDFPEELL